MTERVLAEADVIAGATAAAAERLRAWIATDGPLVLVGVRTGGLVWAQRLATAIGAPPPGALDIALYRDDVTTRIAPEVGPTELPDRLDGARVVLVDDVLYTGRTVRAALDALLDYGRPRSVRLVVLVDRGHRELPIAADVVGLVAETTATERVRVELAQAGPGPADRVIVRGGAGG